MTVEGEIKKCREAMTNLANRGYQLSPFIDGVWRHETITEWRILPGSCVNGDGEIDDDDSQQESVDKLKELLFILGDDHAQ